MAELEREKAFYDAHQAEFREKYFDKWLVITGDSLWGVYGSTTDAVEAALGSLEPGKIMIHRPSDDGKVFYIGPRVYVEHPENDKTPNLHQEIVYSGDSLLEIPY